MAEVYDSQSRFDNTDRPVPVAFLRYNGGNVGDIGKPRPECPCSCSTNG
jgi:hypothetical protein